jgi:hypothetical protein
MVSGGSKQGISGRCPIATRRNWIKARELELEGKSVEQKYG